MTVRVLFLCTGNSARSIMAEALLAKLGGPAFAVYSAGTNPKGINPYTVRVLAEAHLDARGLHSKHMDQFVGETFDYVITVCDQAAEQCPMFPNEPRRIHWSFPDPAAVEGTDDQRLAAFRQTMKEMRNRLATFIPVAERTKDRAKG
jgi:arsenate reductase